MVTNGCFRVFCGDQKCFHNFRLLHEYSVKTHRLTIMLKHARICKFNQFK
nr:MAG TPA: hypothetical protein [Crassvirales sp.]